MENNDLLQQLAQMSSRTYSYVLLAALVGPLTLRLFGFKWLAQIVRPLALVVLLGGIYAKRQRAGAASSTDNMSL